MPIEFHSFEDRDFLVSKGWTRLRMHSSKKTDMWTHPVHSVRELPTILPSEKQAANFTTGEFDRDGFAIGVNFEAPGFVHLTREQALRIEGLHRADVIERF